MVTVTPCMPYYHKMLRTIVVVKSDRPLDCSYVSVARMVNNTTKEGHHTITTQVWREHLAPIEFDI